MKTIDKIVLLLEKNEIPRHKRVSTLTRITGLTPQGLTKWFKGTTAKPDFDNVKIIADFYKVDVSTLWDENAKLTQGLVRTETFDRLNTLIDECFSLGLEDLLVSQIDIFLKVARSSK